MTLQQWSHLYSSSTCYPKFVKSTVPHCTTFCSNYIQLCHHSILYSCTPTRTNTMHCTNNLQVRNAHSSCSASPIQLSCPQCNWTFLSTWGCKQHIRTLHHQPTNANLGEESLNSNSVIDIMSPTEHHSSSTDSCSDNSCSANSPLSSPSSSSHSTQKHCIIIEDVTDDEDDNDASTSRRSPGSHYLYSHFSVRENSNSTPRHETLSSGPKITQTYHPDLPGEFY